MSIERDEHLTAGSGRTRHSAIRDRVQGELPSVLLPHSTRKIVERIVESQPTGTRDEHRAIGLGSCSISISDSSIESEGARETGKPNISFGGR